MDMKNIPEEAAKLLPTKSAKLVVSISILLAAILPSGLLWLNVDTLLPPAVSTRLAILLPSAILLLLGAYLALFFVVRAYNNKKITVTITELRNEENP